jgi:xanthine permease XanP
MADSGNRTDPSGLIYGLNDRPDAARSLLAAIQHLLASVVAIVTPTLVIGGALDLGDHIPYLISMALIVSGVGTFIQSRRVGPVGSGLMTLQGTSFSFVAAITAAGLAVKQRGGGPEAMLAMIFGLCLAGSLVEVAISQFVEHLRRIITPTVTGVVITVIGLSLVQVAMTDVAGGAGAADPGNPRDLLLAAIVIAVIVAANFQPNLNLRIAAVLAGLVAGCAVAAPFGLIDLAALAHQPLVTVPTPLRYGLAFDPLLFVPIGFIYLITAIEATGDLTANSVIAGEPIEGPVYLRRIRGGILGDGVNSAIAALFNTFPNTTFSQNNGVIQMTGIASRHVALYTAPLLVLLGLFPAVGALFTVIPRPVIGGALLVLFGSIAAAGIRILSNQTFDRKRVLTISVSLGLGLGVTLVPEAVEGLPETVRNILGSGITLSGLSAIVLTLAIPEPRPDPDG